MKRYKRILVMVAILVVASIATFALTRYEEKQEQIRTSDAIILEIPADSVTSLSWDYSTGSSLGFNKIDGVWKYQNDEAFPVSEEKVSGILAKFESFGVTFIIENVEDYGQYGLDEPEATLHLATAERSYDIKLGAFSKMDEQRYVDIGDGNVYLVSEDPIDYVDSSLSSMIEHDDTPGFEKVVDITFAGSENYTITRVDESTNTYSPEDDIYFVERDGETVPLDTASVRQYLNTVTSLDLLDYVTYNASEEELAAFGLDEPVLSVTVNYTYTDDNEETVAGTCVFHIGENQEERAASDKSVAEGGASSTVTKYVRIGDSRIIYTVDGVDYATLAAASYNDLRHNDVFWADFEIVTQIDIILEGKEHTLISELNEDEERIWYYKDEDAVIVATEETTETPESTDETEAAEDDREELDLYDLETALLALTADSFTDELPGEVEEIGLTLHLDNENFPTVEIRLYRYDGSFCLAVVDGDPVSLVSRSSVMDLVEAVQAIVLNS